MWMLKFRGSLARKVGVLINVINGKINCVRKIVNITVCQKMRANNSRQIIIY